MTDGDAPKTRKARKLVLPSFVLTEVCEVTDEGAVRIALPVGAIETAYYERPKLTDTGQRVDGKPKWKPSQFNLYPCVLDASGLPWPEATVYIQSRLENTLDPSMSTFDGIADDLTAYRRFLDDESIDWRKFPQQKLARPTYRYSNHMRRAVAAGDIAATSARRRMSTVIGFYRWMSSDGLLSPEHAPWVEKDVLLKLTGSHGFEFSKKVKTTDVSVKVSKQYDPYAGYIDDGGKLRPLTPLEQMWVLEALVALGNTEMSLIHLLALFTGARIQTVLTFCVRHVSGLTPEELAKPRTTIIRCPVGFGTGIDTKRNKKMSLRIPLWLYRKLLIYAESDRARRRRNLAKGGDSNGQYLFLSKYGYPLYSSKKDSRIFDAESMLRYPIKGQSVRKFMAEAVIPYIRAKHDATFTYQFHDLRASFGMNLTDKHLKLVSTGERTLHQVREFVKFCMGHDSAAVTDRYLQFRGNLAHVLQVDDDHDEHLMKLAENVG